METSTLIMVVDDETSVRDCLKQFLEKEGYHVLTAGNGIEALSVLESQSVDLIIADIAMPNMNGYQLYERVVENPQWVMMPFIFLTARALDSDVRYGKELGVDAYLTKPFRKDDLLTTVHGRLRRAQQLADAFAQVVRRPRVEEDTMSVGRLQIDLERRYVWLDGRQVYLSAKEFQLLACLARQDHKVVPVQDLVQVTHNLRVGHNEASSLLRPLVRSLRRKLGYSSGHMGCIQNVRGVGYQLIAP